METLPKGVFQVSSRLGRIGISKKNGLLEMENFSLSGGGSSFGSNSGDESGELLDMKK